MMAMHAKVSPDPIARRVYCSMSFLARVPAVDNVAAAPACAPWAALARPDGEALRTRAVAPRLLLVARGDCVGDVLCSALCAAALLGVLERGGGGEVLALGAALSFGVLLGEIVLCAAAAILLGACWRSTTARIAQRMLKMAVNTAYASLCMQECKSERYCVAGLDHVVNPSGAMES